MDGKEVILDVGEDENVGVELSCGCCGAYDDGDNEDEELRNDGDNVTDLRKVGVDVGGMVSDCCKDEFKIHSSFFVPADPLME